MNRGTPMLQLPLRCFLRLGHVKKISQSLLFIHRFKPLPRNSISSSILHNESDRTPKETTTTRSYITQTITLNLILNSQTPLGI